MKTLKRNRELIVVLLALTFVLGACASVQTNLTPKQQATIWMDIYNAQYDDTYTVMTSPYATETQKAIGRQKKAILTQVWPLLKAYTSVVDKGGVPSVEDTKAITDLINQLTVLAGGH